MKQFVHAARFSGYRYPRFYFGAEDFSARAQTDCKLFFRRNGNRGA